VAHKIFTLPSYFFVRTEQDQKNFSQMGVDVGRTTITGNIKYDTLTLLDNKNRSEKRFTLLGLSPETFCVIGGSTWEGEEEALLADRHRLILAPRRMARLPSVKQLVEQSGRSWSYWSEVKKTNRWTTDVLLIDTLGDLKDLYGVADVAFVGGSLIPHGGQSPLEPAAAATPVLFGTSMENFHEEAEALLKEEGAVQIHDAIELKRTIDDLSRDPVRRKNMGQSAQQSIKRRQGMSKKIVDSLVEKLGLEND
jgi:3-deoxy-D-manno-octulosonic-acid transferase